MKTLLVHLAYFDCANMITGSKYGWYLRFDEKAAWRGPYCRAEINMLLREPSVTCQFDNPDGPFYVEEIIADANSLLVQ